MAPTPDTARAGTGPVSASGPRFLASAPMRASLAAAALYCLAMALAWAGLSTQMPVDWALELVLTQELKPYYAASNPPLYSWIAWVLQRLLPPGQAVLLTINYLATFATFALAAFAAHRLFDNRAPNARILAALAPWSLFLILPYGRLNFGFVNTQLLLPCVLASAVLLLAIARRPRLAWFAALGLVAGLGALTKLNYLFAIACLLAAALLQPALRAALLRPGLALAVVLALALAAPYAVAFHEAGNDLLALLRSKTGAASPSLSPMLSYSGRVGAGLASVGAGLANYLGPAFLLGLAGWLPGRDRRGGRGGRGGRGVDPAQAAARRFLRDALLIGLAVILAGVLFFGVTRVQPWYLHAFFLLGPLYALTFWDAERISRRAVYAAGAVVLGAAAAQTALRAVEFTPRCIGKCRDVVPYDALARQLRTAGFARGTILSIGVRVAGNLRAHFPRSRVATLDLRHLPRQRAGPIGQCLVIWRADEVASMAAARKAVGRAFIALRLPGPASETPVRTAKLAWHGWPAAGRAGRAGATVWRYVLIEKGNARCG